MPPISGLCLMQIAHGRSIYSPVSDYCTTVLSISTASPDHIAQAAWHCCARRSTLPGTLRYWGYVDVKRPHVLSPAILQEFPNDALLKRTDVKAKEEYIHVDWVPPEPRGATEPSRSTKSIKKPTLQQHRGDQEDRLQRLSKQYGPALTRYEERDRILRDLYPALYHTMKRTAEGECRCCNIKKPRLQTLVTTLPRQVKDGSCFVWSWNPASPWREMPANGVQDRPVHWLRKG